eukprot:TRINITY_DN9753_c0_g1_i1.p1 TRINITY_DN9753_c0_g1~~TRINITY_DN9753_c0_g1_i1.p1  ORF type:complete len:1234 (+),score=264.05 TRINITY_DN9753_c0_g1_i1:358-4059(+)
MRLQLRQDNQQGRASSTPINPALGKDDGYRSSNARTTTSTSTPAGDATRQGYSNDRPSPGRSSFSPYSVAEYLRRMEAQTPPGALPKAQDSTSYTSLFKDRQDPHQKSPTRVLAKPESPTLTADRIQSITAQRQGHQADTQIGKGSQVSSVVDPNLDRSHVKFQSLFQDTSAHLKSSLFGANKQKAEPPAANQHSPERWARPRTESPAAPHEFPSRLHSQAYQPHGRANPSASVESRFGEGVSKVGPASYSATGYQQTGDATKPAPNTLGEAMSDPALRQSPLSPKRDSSTIPYFSGINGGTLDRTGTLFTQLLTRPTKDSVDQLVGHPSHVSERPISGPAQKPQTHPYEYQGSAAPQTRTNVHDTSHSSNASFSSAANSRDGADTSQSYLEMSGIYRRHHRTSSNPQEGKAQTQFLDASVLSIGQTVAEKPTSQHISSTSFPTTSAVTLQSSQKSSQNIDADSSVTNTATGLTTNSPPTSLKPLGDNPSSKLPTPPATHQVPGARAQSQDVDASFNRSPAQEAKTDMVREEIQHDVFKKPDPVKIPPLALGKVVPNIPAELPSINQFTNRSSESSLHLDEDSMLGSSRSSTSQLLSVEADVTRAIKDEETRWSREDRILELRQRAIKDKYRAEILLLMKAKSSQDKRGSDTKMPGAAPILTPRTADNKIELLKEMFNYEMAELKMLRAKARKESTQKIMFLQEQHRQIMSTQETTKKIKEGNIQGLLAVTESKITKDSLRELIDDSSSVGGQEEPLSPTDSQQSTVILRQEYELAKEKKRQLAVQKRQAEKELRKKKLEQQLKKIETDIHQMESDLHSITTKVADIDKEPTHQPQSKNIHQQTKLESLLESDEHDPIVETKEEDEILSRMTELEEKTKRLADLRKVLLEKQKKALDQNLQAVNRETEAVESLLSKVTEVLASSDEEVRKAPQQIIPVVQRPALSQPPRVLAPENSQAPSTQKVFLGNVVLQPPTVIQPPTAIQPPPPILAPDSAIAKPSIFVASGPSLSIQHTISVEPVTIETSMSESEGKSDLSSSRGSSGHRPAPLIVPPFTPTTPIKTATPETTPSEHDSEFESPDRYDANNDSIFHLNQNELKTLSPIEGSPYSEPPMTGDSSYLDESIIEQEPDEFEDRIINQGLRFLGGVLENVIACYEEDVNLNPFTKSVNSKHLAYLRTKQGGAVNPYQLAILDLVFDATNTTLSSLQSKLEVLYKCYFLMQTCFIASYEYLNC